MGKLTEDEAKLSKAVCDEITPYLIGIHAFRMPREACERRVGEDLATICCLIVEGHIILKHKEGSTTNDIIRAFQAKDSKEDSPAQSKEPKDES